MTYNRATLQKTSRILALITAISLPVIGVANQSLTANKQTFIQTVSKQYKIPQAQVTDIVEHIHYNPDIIKKMTTPYEGLSWQKYRAHFITTPRIHGGHFYQTQHANTFQKAYQQFGVDQNTITAIIGVESFYGKHTGSYNVLDALGTLAFHYPPRAKFFQRELQQYIVLSLKNNLPITTLKGSYAGALGIPQFMPSSYNHYAVPGKSQQAPVNLFTDHDDAIMSVGNFLKDAGWQRNQPVACSVKPNKTINPTLVSKNTKPQHTLAWYAQRQVSSACTQSLNPNTMAALVNMGSTATPDYWLVFKNFNAIMRYNPRINYAMAVFQLSQAINVDRQHG